MGAYAARRVVSLVLIVLAMTCLVFVLSRLLPGAPVEMMLGDKPTAAQIAVARHDLGLDQALPVQFLRFVGHAIHGDFGRSLRTGRPVTQEIGERMSASIELVTLALLLTVAVGIPAGVLAAARRGTAVDHVARAVSVSLGAVPVFFLGALLQLLFYGSLHWLPLHGRIDGDLVQAHPFGDVTGLYLVDTLLAGQWTTWRSAAAHLAMPVAALAAASLATVFRVTRNVMAEVLQTDYIRTARAYGLSNARLYFGCALKPALVPLLTVIGLTYGFLLGGSVIVEYLFDWPGIGGYIVDSVVTNDYPAVIGVTLMVSTLYLAINLVVDLLYHRLDARLAP